MVCEWRGRSVACGWIRGLLPGRRGTSRRRIGVDCCSAVEAPRQLRDAGTDWSAGPVRCQVPGELVGLTRLGCLTEAGLWPRCCRNWHGGYWPGEMWRSTTALAELQPELSAALNAVWLGSCGGGAELRGTLQQVVTVQL